MRSPGNESRTRRIRGDGELLQPIRIGRHRKSRVQLRLRFPHQGRSRHPSRVHHPEGGRVPFHRFPAVLEDQAAVLRRAQATQVPGSAGDHQRNLGQPHLQDEEIGRRRGRGFRGRVPQSGRSVHPSLPHRFRRRGHQQAAPRRPDDPPDRRARDHGRRAHLDHVLPGAEPRGGGAAARGGRSRPRRSQAHHGRLEGTQVHHAVHQRGHEAVPPASGPDPTGAGR
mmetsp:Transcript_413/g.3116  ORF Transcript_413/g.3116 Transcript_413/m.3116 type:complete len:225 (+) Transcript_413:706-1380(+)